MNMMTPTLASTIRKLEQNEVWRNTKTPLRMAGQCDFAVPAHVLFPRISEPEQITQ